MTSTTLDDDELAASLSDGHPLPGVEINIVNPDGEVQPRGAEGEICYRSPGAMLTYWEDPDAFEKIVLPGGWRRTGDVGRVDDVGCLRVTGRKPPHTSMCFLTRRGPRGSAPFPVGSPVTPLW